MRRSLSTGSPAASRRELYAGGGRGEIRSGIVSTDVGANARLLSPPRDIAAAAWESWRWRREGDDVGRDWAGACHGTEKSSV